MVRSPTSTASSRLASTKSPHIEAILSMAYRFATPEKAQERMEQLKKQFTLSKHQFKEASQASVILWIRDYEVTPEESTQGYMGNYALITHAEVPAEPGKYLLYATKLASELKFHPQRARPPQKHPDWGHPILRAIKRGKTFTTPEQAQGELQLLHEQFPDITIPCTLKLYIIVYDKALKRTPPTQKYVFTVEATPEGQFIIKATVNEHKPKHPNAQAPAPTTESKESVGRFTAELAAKRAKKKRKPAPRPATQAAETPPEIPTT